VSTMPPRAPLDAAPKVSAARGTLWAYIQNWAARGITLLVFFVLARLLTPAQFGTFAVAMVFLTLGEIFVEQLFSGAIVQRNELSHEHLDAAFWATLSIGLLLVLLTLLAAPVFARAFDSPEVAPLIRALAPVFVLMALASVPASLLRRALNYRALAQRSALSNLVSGGVAIGAAALGWGVWAFVAQQLCFHLVGTIILWRNESWRPHLHVPRSALKQMSGFSTRLMLVKLLDLVETRIVELVVGHRLGLATLGNYALATRAHQAAAQLLAAPLWDSSIAVFARQQGDPAALARALAERAKLAALLIVPAFLFAAASAPLLVPAVFGPRWSGASGAFQVLCVLGALRAVIFLFGSMLQATGHPGASVRVGMVRTAATVAALFALLPLGPTGVAASLLVAQLVALPVLLHALRRHVGIGARQMAAAVARPVLAALLAAGAGAAVASHWSSLQSPIVGAAVALGTCVLLFLILVMTLMPETLRHLLRRLPGIRSFSGGTRIRVVGAFGERNFGDDLLMWSMHRCLRAKNADARISVAVSEPRESGYVQASLPFVQIERRFKPIPARWDVEILAGGTQFFSFPGRGVAKPRAALWARIRALLRDEGALHAATRLLLRPLMPVPDRYAVGIGVGPFLAGNELESRRVLEGMQRIWLRDVESTEYPRKWGLAQIEDGADICFGSDLLDLPPQSALPQRPRTVGVVIRGWGYATEAANFQIAMLDAVRQLQAQGFEVRLFAFCEPADHEPIAYFKANGVEVDTWDPERRSTGDYLAALQSCDFFITARFHGVVIASLLGRPAIGVAVDPKVRQMCAKLGLHDFVWEAPFDSQHLTPLVDAMRERWPDVVVTVERQRQQERAAADRMLARMQAEVFR